MILITGATGNVGRIAVERLAGEDRKVRALSRNPERTQWPTGVEAVAGDLTDPASLTEALAGIESVFLFAVPEAGPGFVAAAQEAGVRHVVLLSSGAIDDTTEVQDGAIAAYHFAVEQELRASTIDWTFLRCEVFATNCLQWSHQTKHGDEIRGAFADAAGTPIHEADIADVAVAALTSQDHAGKIYHLTGPESLTHADQARIIGEVLGRHLRYVEIPAEQVRRQLAPFVPAPVLDDILRVWERSVTVPRPVTADVEAITGHAARDFRTWVRDHADAF